MADTKVSDETAATTPTGTELVRIVQGGSSKKTTLAVAGHQFRGARARMTSDDTAVNATTEAIISLDVAEFDTDGFWSAGAPTRLTIPASKGIKYVEVTGQGTVTLSAANTFRSAYIKHYNGAGVVQRTCGARFIDMGTTGSTLVITTGPVPVADGDYFELAIREESDTSVTIDGTTSIHAFLALTVLGMEPI